MGTPPPSPSRIVSLDQFRGYTMAGMFVVNYLGSFAITPAILKHHNTYCSYADTIMPQFLFAVGFAFRLTFARRAAGPGLHSAYWRSARRIAGLAVLAVVLYTLGSFGATWHRLSDGDVWPALGELFKRQWFQTLLQIAATSLWILPVIRASGPVRIAFTVLSAAAHVALSAWFNFAWVNTPPNGIDGGPLGFLTWTIPAMVGTLASDALLNAGDGTCTGRLLAWAVSLMLLGYVVSCGTRFYDVSESQRGAVPKLATSPVLPPWDRLSAHPGVSLLAEPPFVPPPPPAMRQWNYWMMSQRSGSLSYLTFAAGFSLVVYVLFYLACDRLDWRLGLLQTLGTNALTGYILHGAMEEVVKPWIGRDAPGWMVAAGFAVCFGVTYAVLWIMDKEGIHLRL